MYPISTQEIEESWEIAKIIFPYTKMKSPQKKIIKSILSLNQPLLISSQIGVGKTAALLTSLLALKKPGEKIVIFVRTKAQINVFLRELSNIFRQILKHWDVLETHFDNFPIFVPFLGKNELCLKAKKDYPGELYTHICNLTRCPLKAKTQRATIDDIIESVRKLYESFSEIISKEDILESLNSDKYCPYFFSYFLMQKADVVITSYPFLENNALFTRLYYSLGTSVSKTLIAIDEAHNLFKPINQELTRTFIEKANQELPHPIFSEILNLIDTKKVINNEFDEYKLKSLEDELFTLLQSQLIHNSPPAFYAYIVYHFLLSSQGKIILSDGQKLSIVNIQPADILNKFTEARRFALISGSFEPIRSFQRLFSLPNSKILQVFPPKEEIDAKYYVLTNQKLNGKYDNRTHEYYVLIASTILNIFEAIDGHTIVFVPSYSYMKELERTGVLKADIIESRELDITTLQAIISSSDDKKLIVCVTGGKMSEGTEFSVDGRSLIKGVIITALPYPPPSPENQIIHDDLMKKFGASVAKEFTVTIPMIQRLAQSFGRAIRNQGDRAVHILLDPRGTQITKEFPFERYSSVKTLKTKLKQFFKSHNLKSVSK